MSDKTLARRASVSVFFNNVNIDVKRFLISVTYTDNAEGQADDLQLQLEDKDDIWLQSWLNEAIEASAENIVTVDAELSKYKVASQGGVALRTGPGAGYNKIVTLPYNTAISVKEIINGWATVIYDDQKAYVSAAYITADTEEEKTSSASSVKIQAVIARENWNGDGKDDLLDSGEFELDSASASGPPSIITIKATSLPYKASIRKTKKTKAWEKYPLSRIAAEIASQNGMGCMFLSSYDPFYNRAEQIEAADVVFLDRLCKNAGIALKATANIIVLFEEKNYESLSPVRTITKGNDSYTRYSLSRGQNDTQYGSCHVSYTDPLTGKTIEATYKDPNSDDSSQILEYTAKVSSVAEALKVAEKRLRLKNKFAKTGSFTFPGDPSLVSGSTVQLSGWGAFDGKYIIQQAVHTVGSAYTTTIKIRQVLEGY